MGYLPWRKLEMSQNNLLEIQDLKTHFFTRAATVKAVDGVNFTLAPLISPWHRVTLWG